MRLTLVLLGALWFILAAAFGLRLGLASPRGGVRVDPRPLAVPPAPPAAARPRPATDPAGDFSYAPAAAPARPAPPPAGFQPSLAPAASEAPVYPVITPAPAAQEAPAPEEAQRVQCRGLTKKGTRCRRKTADPTGLCHQHREQGTAPAAPAAPAYAVTPPASAQPAVPRVPAAVPPVYTPPAPAAAAPPRPPTFPVPPSEAPVAAIPPAAYPTPGGEAPAPDAQVQSVQCGGLTKKGTRCRRRTLDPSGFCPQHR